MIWYDITSAPKDQPVLLAGGHLNEHDFRDDDPREWITDPVVARWRDGDWEDDPGYWLVTKYDGGVCPLEYHEPRYWSPIIRP